MKHPDDVYNFLVPSPRSQFLEGVAFASWCGQDSIISVSSFGELKCYDWDSKDHKDGNPFAMTMLEASLRVRLTKGRSPLQVMRARARVHFCLAGRGEGGSIWACKWDMRHL